MATNDPASPNNPNAKKTPASSTGTAPNNQDPNGTISAGLPTPGSLDTAYTGGGTKQDKDDATLPRPSASAGAIHSSFKRSDNTPNAQTENFSGTIIDAASSSVPVAPITERREISRRTTYGPGQDTGIRPGSSPITPGPSQVALSPNDLKAPSGADSNSVWQPAGEEVVGDGDRVITSNLTTYPATGTAIDTTATRANPSVDVTAREAGGSSAAQDPNAESFQGDYRGERTELTGWQPQTVVQKTDVSGRPVNLESLANSGDAESARNTDFKMFTPPAVPVNGAPLKGSLLGRSNNQPNSASSGLGTAENVSPASQSSFSANDGTFYGVNALHVPAEGATESTTLGPASSGNLVLVAKTMPGYLVTEGRVASISADIRNTNEVAELSDVIVELTAIDSSGTRHSLAGTQLTVPASSAVAVSQPLPAGVPVGPMSVMAKVSDSSGAEILSSRFDTVVVPESFGSREFGKGERLPKSVKNSLGLESTAAPKIKGRAFPKRNTAPAKEMVATSTRITGAIKISQAAKAAGFDPLITVTVDPSGSNTTSSYKERVQIGTVDVDPLTHEAAFDISGVTVGHAVRISVTDTSGASKPSFAWALYTSGLDSKSTLSGSCVGNGTYLGGSIATDVCNGLVILENTRTGSRIPANTDANGNVVFYTDANGIVNRFDATAGDTINVFSSEASGAYTTLLLTVPVIADSASTLSSTATSASLRAVPDEKAISDPRFPTYVR